MQNPNRKGILWIVLLWLAAVGIFLFGVLAHAQTPQSDDQPDHGGMRRVAIEGTVRHVLRHACTSGLLASRRERLLPTRCSTTEVVVATGNGLVNVRLGPTKFIRDNRFFFVDGDRLRVIGFQAANQGRATIVSEEVIKSKRALTFRDPHGRPLWSHRVIADEPHGPVITQKRNQTLGKDEMAQLSLLAGSDVATNLRFQISAKEKEHEKQ
ncbi:MAG: hypothetical protein WBB89_01200 [Candidatus Acidiferrum sp.]